MYALLMERKEVEFVECSFEETKLRGMDMRERALMREKRLFEASLSGNVESLNELVQEDKLILARVSLTCFNETSPLHVAAMLGHVDFAKVLLSHKRDLVTELDSQRRSPLHLASANGYVEIVKILLMVNSTVCLIRDEDGMTPLHLAAMKGRVDVVTELAQVQPEVIRYTLDRGETILHLCVIHNRLEALKRLMELSTFDDFVNVRDDYDNAILHTATALRQIQTIKYLLNRTGVRVNAMNGNAFTALDIIEHTPKDLKAMEIRELLVEAGALRARSIPASEHDKPQMTSESDRNEMSRLVLGRGDVAVAAPPSNVARKDAMVRIPSNVIISDHLKKKQDIWLTNKHHNNVIIRDHLKKKKQDTRLTNKRDSLMVAATVIAAMAYQAGLSPPSGVWQEDKVDEETQKMLYYAGTSIMAYNFHYAFTNFWVCNTMSFVASLSTIFLLISGLPLKKRLLLWLLTAAMWVTITCMALSYLISLLAISPEHETLYIFNVVAMSVLVWLGLIAIIFIAHTCRFIRWIFRKLRKCRKGCVSRDMNECA